MFLVFDSGTTNTKAFLFSGRDAKLIASASYPVKTICCGPGIVEQPAETWWSSLVQALRLLQRSERWRKHDIEAVGISSQGGTFVPLDAGLNPVRNGITWLDNRACTIAGSFEKRHMHLKTGRYPESWMPPAVCLWLKENEPSTIMKTSRISFVSDYLNFKLTGSFFLDRTSAQMSCFYDIRKKKWDPGMVEMAGMGMEKMPAVIPSNCTGGKVTRDSAELLDVPEGIPVVAGGHDQYCASLGAGAMNKGSCLLSCGTALALLITTRKLLLKEKTSWVPGRHVRNGYYGYMSSISNGCVVLDWVKKNFKIRQINRDKANNVNFVTSLSEKSGAINNISLATTGADIYLAALESLSITVQNRIGEAEDAVKVNSIIMLGGGAKEKLLPYMVEKYSGVKVLIPEINEAAGRGAALLAAEREE